MVSRPKFKAWQLKTRGRWNDAKAIVRDRCLKMYWRQDAVKAATGKEKRKLDREIKSLMKEITLATDMMWRIRLESEHMYMRLCKRDLY